MPTRDPHGPPADLDKAGRSLFFKLRKFLEEQDTYTHSDAFVLGQACRYEQRARTARLAMTDESGQVVTTTVGYKGQLVQHPDLKTATEAEVRFVECLRELGLTPAARKRMEIEKPGDGSEGKFGGAF